MFSLTYNRFKFYFLKTIIKIEKIKNPPDRGLQAQGGYFLIEQKGMSFHLQNKKDQP